MNCTDQCENASPLRAAHRGPDHTLSPVFPRSALDKAYVAARLQPLLTAWDGFTAAGPQADPSQQPALGDWLPGFYDEVLALVDLDSRWCGEALSAHSPRLLLKLLAELAARTQTSFSTRLTAAVALTTRATVGAAAGPAASLPALIALHNTTVAYGKSLCRLLESASPEERRTVLEAAFAGFESFKRGYGDLERRQLGSDINRIERTLKEEGSLEAVARRMNSSVAAAAEVAEAAVQRCVALTGGSETDAMLRAIDDGLVAYLTVRTHIPGRATRTLIPHRWACSYLLLRYDAPGFHFCATPAKTRELKEGPFSSACSRSTPSSASSASSWALPGRAQTGPPSSSAPRPPSASAAPPRLRRRRTR